MPDRHPARLPVLLVGLLIGLAGCPVDTTQTFDQCDLDLALDTDTVAVGETVTATGRPLTDDFDTVVRVGGSDAEITDVDRPADACAICDGCRLVSECAICETCGACAEDCAECVETVKFVVPSAPLGPTTVTITNGFGVSPPLPLEIVEGEPTED